MRIVIILGLLWNAALADTMVVRPADQCLNFFQRTLKTFTVNALKVQNQFYQLHNKNFIYFKKLLWVLKREHFATQERWVRLADLRHMHPVNYPIDYLWQRIKQRVSAIEMNRDVLLKEGFSLKMQKELVPSHNPIRVIRDREGRYVVQDGNGRLYSIRQVFGDNPDLKVQVVEIQAQDNEQVQTLLEKIRAENALTD